MSHVFQPEGVLGVMCVYRCHVDVPSMSSCRSTYENEARSGRSEERQVLLRKEVIQPHLPVRLPCYDLVPIANPTLDGSLQKG